MYTCIYIHKSSSYTTKTNMLYVTHISFKLKPKNIVINLTKEMKDL